MFHYVLFNDVPPLFFMIFIFYGKIALQPISYVAKILMGKYLHDFNQLLLQPQEAGNTARILLMKKLSLISRERLLQVAQPARGVDEDSSSV